MSLESSISSATNHIVSYHMVLERWHFKLHLTKKKLNSEKLKKSYSCSKMSENNEEIRYILKFLYKKGKNATQATNEICEVYGDDAVSVRVAQQWFARFRSGNFDVKDAPRSGRPIVEKVDEIMEKIDQDRHISCHDIAKALNIHHQTVLNHLKKAGYKKKLDVWVPHELSVKNLMDRINICDSLLKRNEIEPFLKRMVTGDEKWIKYDNNVRKRSWCKGGEAQQMVAKPGLTPRKVMLCVWWDWKGIIHYELLQPARTIDSTLYCQQLMRLKQAIEKNGQNWSAERASSSIRTTLGHTHLWWLGKNWESLAGKFWCIHHIALTLHHRTTICFGQCRTPLME